MEGGERPRRSVWGGSGTRAPSQSSVRPVTQDCLGPRASSSGDVRRVLAEARVGPVSEADSWRVEGKLEEEDESILEIDRTKEHEGSELVMMERAEVLLEVLDVVDQWRSELLTDIKGKQEILGHQAEAEVLLRHHLVCSSDSLPKEHVDSAGVLLSDHEFATGVAAIQYDLKERGFVLASKVVREVSELTEGAFGRDLAKTALRQFDENEKRAAFLLLRTALSLNNESSKPDPKSLKPKTARKKTSKYTTPPTRKSLKKRTPTSKHSRSHGDTSDISRITNVIRNKQDLKKSWDQIKADTEVGMLLGKNETVGNGDSVPVLVMTGEVKKCTCQDFKEQGANSKLGFSENIKRNALRNKECSTVPKVGSSTKEQTCRNVDEQTRQKLARRPSRIPRLLARKTMSSPKSSDYKKSGIILRNDFQVQGISSLDLTKNKESQKETVSNTSNIASRSELFISATARRAEKEEWRLESGSGDTVEGSKRRTEQRGRPGFVGTRVASSDDCEASRDMDDVVTTIEPYIMELLDQKMLDQLKGSSACQDEVKHILTQQSLLNEVDNVVMVSHAPKKKPPETAPQRKTKKFSWKSFGILLGMFLMAAGLLGAILLKNEGSIDKLELSTEGVSQMGDALWRLMKAGPQ